ncbi:hypothetical protein AAFP35_12310 [Gordonia sp. CPCC 206044]|uniref:hypothetical protein n=1 Tax=Gordonia sp. CPCC 206044 TaxID=3140793 RepID=UPI003AF3DD45
MALVATMTGVTVVVVMIAVCHVVVGTGILLQDRLLRMVGVTVMVTTVCRVITLLHLHKPPRVATPRQGRHTSVNIP